MGVKLAAASVLAIGLAGCGGSSSASHPSAAPPQSTSAPPTTSATSTGAGSSTTTPASTTTAATPRCVAADLTGSFLGQQGATGHGELGFGLRNATTHSCRTFGYPGVLFLDRHGSPLPTSSSRTTHDFFGATREVPLTVAPGASVSFRLGVTHGVVPGEPCSTAYALQVIAPDDTATLRISIPGGAYQCRTATVSPLMPGTSAFP